MAKKPPFVAPAWRWRRAKHKAGSSGPWYQELRLRQRQLDGERNHWKLSNRMKFTNRLNMGNKAKRES